MKRRMLLGLAFAALACAGCATRSPILMFRDRAEENPKKVPLKVGLAQVKFDFEDKELSHIKTQDSSTFPFLMTLYASFPKDDEKQYVEDCIVQYVQDVNLFDFIYAQPYDPKDVDVVLQVTVKEFDVSNTSWGEGLKDVRFFCTWLFPLLLMNLGNAGVAIPFEVFIINYVVNFALMLGELTTLIPQEHFVTTQGFHIAVCLPNGDRILSYETRMKEDEWVHMWRQPFGKYMWYRSVFRRIFLKIWDDFRSKIEQDGQQIVAAVEKAKRGE